ncbi:MAG: DUF2202 domain-containing protein [Bacteroidales bacterium]
MKRQTAPITLIMVMSLFTLLLVSCKKDTETATTTPLTDSDKNALLFMLEEEKLARDTYTYLWEVWQTNPFTNIKSSEQSHMDAIAQVLTSYGIQYTILPAGQFADSLLLNFYNQFVTSGSISSSNALQIGATIEDLDISDLEKYTAQSTNETVINVFNSLECGSRNHLRSFVSAIVSVGGSYTPQFISQDYYSEIISSSKEKCN